MSNSIFYHRSRHTVRILYNKVRVEHMFVQIDKQLYLSTVIKDRGTWCLSISFFFKKILLEYSLFIMLCWFLLSSKVNQLYIYIYPPFFKRFFPQKGHCRILRLVPCAIQQVLISYLFYIWQCVYVDPELPMYPSPAPPCGLEGTVNQSTRI